MTSSKTKNPIINRLRGLNLRNTSILFTAMLINVGLGYVITKLNSEYLSIAEFGMYSLLINTILFARVFFSFGTFEATSRLVAIEKNPDTSQKIYAANLILTFILAILLAIFIYILSQIFDSIFEIKIGFLLFAFAPLTIAVLFQAMLFVILRGFNYIGMLSSYTVIPRFVYVVIIGILLFTNKFNLHNSLFAFLGSLLIISVLFAFLIRPKFSEFRKYLNILKSEVKNFGSHLFVANISTAFFYNSDKLILAYFVDAEKLAYYALAFSLTASIPYFSNALSTSAFKNFAGYSNIPRRHLWINFTFITVLTLFLLFLSRFIILTLFSAKYAPAILPFNILAIAFAFNAYSVPYTMFFKAKGKGVEVRNITFAMQIVFVILNLILIPMFGIKGASISALVAFSGDYFLYLFWYKKLFNTD